MADRHVTTSVAATRPTHLVIPKLSMIPNAFGIDVVIAVARQRPQNGPIEVTHHK